jgi:restriction endonuclease Mrr
VAFPDFQALLLPLLRAVTDGEAHSIDEVAPEVASQLSLTPDEVAAAGPNPRHTVLEYRLRWARPMLHKAELVTVPGELLLQITSAGRDVLARNLTALDQEELARRSPAFAQWQLDMGDMKLEPTLRGEEQAVWVIRAGSGGADAAAFLAKSVVAMGFGESTDLTGRARCTPPGRW